MNNIEYKQVPKLHLIIWKQQYQYKYSELWIID